MAKSLAIRRRRIMTQMILLDMSAIQFTKDGITMAGLPSAKKLGQTSAEETKFDKIPKKAKKY